jgi:hypothetical protein
MSATTTSIEIIIEAAEKRAFASAVAWPGWSRSGKDDALALEAFARYASRYALVAGRAGIGFPDTVTLDDLEVVERDEGSAATTFGVPGRVAHADLRPVTSAEARRLTDLVVACWGTFAEIVARAPAELRKGPRGGGRDRDKVVAHVEEAEHSYARSMGVRLPASTPSAEVRAAIVEVLGLNSDGSPLHGGAGGQRETAQGHR